MKKSDWLWCLAILIVLLAFLCGAVKLNIDCRAQGGVLVKGLGGYVCVDREVVK